MFKKVYQELVSITYYLDRIRNLLEAITVREGAREVFYICNGEDPKCCKKYCFKNGTGNCQYTTDVRYAKNFNHDDMRNKFYEK